MSTKRRQDSPDRVAEGNDASFIGLDRGNKRPNPDAVRNGSYRSPSVPMQPFRPHHRPRFISEGARPANRNKRPRPEHLPPVNQFSLHSPNSFPYSVLPQWFDVTPGLPDAIPQADGEMPYWKAEHAAFIGSAAGLGDEGWIGKRPLGFGTFGTAGLWERRDENNAVVEQMVIKESKMIPVEKWNGKVPEEVKMMRRMNKTGCQAVPDLITYKRYPHVRKHRIYMEYCPYSDLVTLNLNYKRFRTYLPEPFLWYTFYNLVKVAAAMQNGPDDTDWGYQIVHRDLKPANIFLGLEDEDSGFPPFPVSKTGDWGLARKVEPSDHKNPIGLRGAGTRAYYAPEQRILHSGDALNTQMAGHRNGTAPLCKLSAHTNAWGIGAIMFELLTHEAVAYYLHDDEWAVNEVFTDIPNVGNPKYSDALTELIKLCLMPEPWDRPSIEELELKIGAKCRSIIGEYAANPSRREQDRLYYKGSEINQMPPGNWNYWNPVMKDVPNPSASPDSKEPINPFTSPIVYPHFPTSELDGLEHHSIRSPDGSSDGSDDEGKNQHENSKDGPRRVGVAPLIVISSDPRSGPKGNNAGNPLIISDSDESNRSNGSDDRSSEGDSADSDDSDARRRMAIKTIPGI